jgi:RNA ligase
MIHPARSIPFSELYDGLQAAKARGLISEQIKGELRLYCYTKSTVYEREWSDITTLARGLILDVARGEIVATPFPKFFNVGERGETIPDLPFETFEKVDGSLIIIFWHAGEWHTATKGSLRSEQAAWAAGVLARSNLSHLTPGTTYLAEAVYPENRIVVHYEESGLVLLGAYDDRGEEFSYGAVLCTGALLGWRCAIRHSFDSVSDLLTRAITLPPTEEGYVLRFSNGLRLKVKGDEYKRIHALISRCTPLAMWEAMAAGDDLQSVRRDLPEEFWTDFDAIIAALERNRDALVTGTATLAAQLAHLTDKQVGLQLNELPADLRGFIFPYRKNNGDLLSGRTSAALFRAIRPTGNNLAGYTPSYALNRVFEEAA